MKHRRELSSREVEALHERLARRLGDSSVPTLPHVAMKIIELVGQPGSAMQDFADVIQTDQALTGRLLRLTNSAYFAQRKPVTSLQRAAVLIGLDRLKAMALGFHLSKVSAGTDEASRRHWTLSLFRGWYALRLVERLDASISGEAFIIGLMMDVGMPQMTLLEGAAFDAIYSTDEPPAKQFMMELNDLPFTHVDVVAALCNVWKLPAKIARPMCLHHNPAPPSSVSDPSGVLHAAAYFIGSLPLDPAHGPKLEAKFSRVGQRLLGLDEKALVEAAAEAARDVEGARDVFSHLIDTDLSVELIFERANGLLSSAVEDLVGNALDQEGGGRSLSLEVGDRRLELESRGGGTVRIYVNNPQGDRLVSEDVDARELQPQRLRNLLPIEGMSEPDFEQLMTSLRSLAA